MSEFSSDQIAGIERDKSYLGGKNNFYFWSSIFFFEIKEEITGQFSKNGLAFRDAFELFDRTGAGTIAYKECSSLARCFGYSPTDAFVKSKISFFSSHFLIFQTFSVAATEWLKWKQNWAKKTWKRKWSPSTSSFLISGTSPRLPIQETTKTSSRDSRSSTRTARVLSGIFHSINVKLKCSKLRRAPTRAHLTRWKNDWRWSREALRRTRRQQRRSQLRHLHQDPHVRQAGHLVSRKRRISKIFLQKLWPFLKKYSKFWGNFVFFYPVLL